MWAGQGQKASRQKAAATNSAEFAKFLLMQQFEAKEIGLRIKQARVERGMTQEDLAEVASFSSRSLTDYETGVTIPYRHLRELSRLLGRSPEWFLHGDAENEASVEVAERLDRIEQAQAEQRKADEQTQQLLQELIARLGPSGEARGRSAS